MINLGLDYKCEKCGVENTEELDILVRDIKYLDGEYCHDVEEVICPECGHEHSNFRVFVDISLSEDRLEKY